jgi:AcrR family transcriptional regulator
MARPITISEHQILDAARAVFLERGFSATTAEVARRAAVAEGSIFKRFRTKQELFFAAMQPTLKDPEWLRKLGERAGRGEVQDNLVEVGLEIIGFFRQLLPLMMMMWSNPSASGLPTPLTQPNPPPLRALKKLAAFFEIEMRKRRVRRHDPEILARMFLGSLQNYAFFEVLLRAHDELPLPAEIYVRGLVAALWNGIAPAARPTGGDTRRERR